MTLATPEQITPAENAVETIEVDVTVPEAFSIKDMALWDGRPTFGGVWIAYPDIDQPERVRIRNDATGKDVIGALYKRERDFPGPKIELSADAAAALGVLAGAPVELTIVALRRKTIVVEIIPEPDPEITDQELNMSTPVRRQIIETDTPSEEDESVTQASPPDPIVIPAAIPIIATEIEETTLPSVQTTANGPETYLQVATLQNRARAEEVVAKLITAGLQAEIRERQTETKILYRIIVGPAFSAEALEIMLSVVKELGFKDAIVLG
ncbi:MAG: SPOR domain-containing protein [Paracoccaceae bacterium]